MCIPWVFRTDNPANGYFRQLDHQNEVFWSYSPSRYAALFDKISKICIEI